MAIVGCGNQGSGELGAWLGDERVHVAAVCDVNRESAGYWSGTVRGWEPARQRVEERYSKQYAAANYKGCDVHLDFREVVARADIDAVYIGVPDHWHAVIAIAMARAGKDIYCQKPLSLTIPEGRAMSDAVRQSACVFQTGSQQRSDAYMRRACELVRNGRIGKLQTVKCGLPSGTPDYGHTAMHTDPEPVPDGFDYDLWLGPAPWAPHCRARTHVNFRWLLDYSGGQLTDWGAHHIDIAQWGMGTQYTGPVEIRNAEATWAPGPVWDTATDYSFEAIYESGVKLLIASKGFNGGVTFEGSEGTVHTDRGRLSTRPRAILDTVIGPDEVQLYRSRNHFRNFIDCVITRGEPVAPVEAAHRSVSIAHLGNIAMRTGTDFKWDPEREAIVDNPAATRLLSRSYRAPWRL